MAYTIEFAALELLWSSPEIRERALQALQSIHESQSVSDNDRETLDTLVGSITQLGDIEFERRKADFVARGQIDTGNAVLREILLNSMQAYRKASASGQNSGEQIIDIQWQQRSDELYDVTVADKALQGNMTLPRILTEYFGVGVSEKRDDANVSAGHGIGAKNQLGWALNGSIEAEGTKVSYSRKKEASEPHWRYYFDIGEKSEINHGMKVTMHGLQLSSKPGDIMQKLLSSFDDPTFTILINGKNIVEDVSYSTRRLKSRQDAKARHLHVTRQVSILQNRKRIPVNLDMWVGGNYEYGSIKVVQNGVVEYESDLWTVGLDKVGDLQLDVKTAAMLPRAKSSLGALEDVIRQEGESLIRELMREIDRNYPNITQAELEAYHKIKTELEDKRKERADDQRDLKKHGRVGTIAKYGLAAAALIILGAGTYAAENILGIGKNAGIENAGIETSAFSGSQSAKPGIDDLGRLGVSPTSIRFWYHQIGQGQNTMPYFMVNSFNTLGLREWSSSGENRQSYRPVILESLQLERYDHIQVTIPRARTEDREIKLPIIPGGQLYGEVYTSKQDLTITKMEMSETGEVYVQFNKELNGVAIGYALIIDKQRQVPELSADQIQKYTEVPADIKLDPKIQEIIDLTRDMGQFKRAQEIVRRLGDIFVYDTSKKTEAAYDRSANTLETLLHGDSNIAPFFGDCDVHNMGAAYVLRMIGTPTIEAVGYVGINGVVTNAAGHGYLLSWFKDKGWVIFDATGTQVLETNNVAVLTQSLKNAVFTRINNDNYNFYETNYDPNAAIDRQESNGFGPAEKAGLGLIALAAAAGAGYYLYKRHGNEIKGALPFAQISLPLKSRRVIPAYLVGAVTGGVDVTEKKVSLDDTLAHSLRGTLFEGKPAMQDPVLGCYIPSGDHADLARSFHHRMSGEIILNLQNHKEIWEPYQGEHYAAIEATTRAIIAEIKNGTGVGWRNVENAMSKLRLGPQYLHNARLPNGNTTLVSDNSLNNYVAGIVIAGQQFKPKDVSYIANQVLTQANRIDLFPIFNDYAFGLGGVTQRINDAAKR